MIKPLRSLRVRLILMFVIIFGLIQVTLGAVGLIVWEQSLRDYFDRQLIQRTQNMATELSKEQRGFFAPTLSRLVREQAGSIYFRDFYVQARDAQGQPVGQSGNLGDHQLPFAIHDTQGMWSGWNRVTTWSGPTAEELAEVAGVKMRLVTMYVAEPGIQPYFLQVATSLQHVQTSAAYLRMLFGVGAALGLVAAALAGWVVTGRAMRRVHVVSELAQRVSPEQLQQRFPGGEREDEVGHMIANVNAMLERLEAGFQAQERFLHDASHELKTPLASLLSEAQTLQSSYTSPEQGRRFAASVEQEARYLGSLLESLLLLTRTESGQPIVQRREASLDDAVVNATVECEPIARQHQVELVTHLAMPDDRGEMRFRGDPELVSAMVSNLLRNAIHFSAPGQQVDVQLGRADAEALITVRDRGPGISPELRPHIFERFVQAHRDGRRRGDGLGLAIARSVAELHGGRIAVDCPADGGSVFTVRLPLVA